MNPTTPKVEPLPGRRPVYPVDAEADAPPERERPQRQTEKADDPASDANADPANHPNDE